MEKEDLESVVTGKDLNHGADIREFQEEVNNVCNACDGGKAAKIKKGYLSICNLDIFRGKYQRPISFKGGKGVYECRKAIEDAGKMQN